MANLPISALLLLGCVVSGTSGGSILCVKCDSQYDKTPGDCEKRPPSPSNCLGSNVQQYCLSVIEYNADNTQRRFVRDCTSLSEGTCTYSTAEEIKAGASAKVCHKVCETDGCNGSVRLTTSTALSLFIFLLALTRLHPLSIRL